MSAITSHLAYGNLKLVSLGQKQFLLLLLTLLSAILQMPRIKTQKWSWSLNSRTGRKIGKHQMKRSSRFFFLNCVSFLSNKSSQRSLICKTDESAVVLGVQLVVSEETSKRALNLVQTSFPFSPALFNTHAGSYREDSLSPESLSLLCR